MRVRERQNGDVGATGPLNELNNIDRTVAIVEAASAMIKTNDFSAVETLFAGQGLALDAMFDSHARETTLSTSVWRSARKRSAARHSRC
jgi:hypothetical protein